MAVQPIHPAPTSSLLHDENGQLAKVKISPAGEQWFTKAYQVLAAPATSAAPPATSASLGTAGAIAFDANFAYFCIAKNTWKRLALAAF